MANREEENIELESQPLNAEKKAEIIATSKSDQKEKIKSIGLTKEELMKYAKDPFWCKLRKILFALFWLLWLSMFVGAFLIIHYVPSCPATSRLRWYQKESVAQINLDLFDRKLNNITDKLKTFQNTFQLRTLLLPNLFQQTTDNEIINHFELNKTIGTQDELSKLIKELKIKYESSIIMDLNVATTSREHEWFKSFLNNQEKYSNYYLIADDSYSDYIGYETEKLDNGRKLITKKGKPCLNLLNNDVRTEFKNIFDKWGRLNVKGFRLLGAPFLLTNQETKQVSKDLQLNQKLIKEWSKEFKHAVSDGVLILQLDDQDADEYPKYYGTQSEPIADIVVNKLISRLDIETSISEIKNQLKTHLNQSKAWNDELNNIGPWTGWLLNNPNDKTKDKLLVCFNHILGYTLPRGMPITRLSFDILSIGLSDEFFKILETEFQNLEKGSHDNARLFGKLSNLRKSHADSIMLGNTEFPKTKLASGSETDEVFTMIRTNDKQGLIVIANLKGGSKDINLDIDFSRIPRTATISATCKVKEGHQFGNRIDLDKSIRLQLNETLVATFDSIL